MSDLANIIMLDEAFQATLQRYAHGNGSSAAIAKAAARNAESQLAELRADAMRYRWLRQPGSTIYVDWIDFDGTPEQLDIAIDAALAADGKDGAR